MFKEQCGSHMVEILYVEFFCVNYNKDVNVKCPQTHAICSKSMHEMPMFAFSSNSDLSFQKTIFTKDVPWNGGKNKIIVCFTSFGKM